MKRFFTFILFAFIIISCEKDVTLTPADIGDVTLAPPPYGSGVQIGVPPFEVPQGAEVQRNYYLTLPSDKDIYVNAVQFNYNEGSHHCNVFKSDSVTKDPATYDDTFTALDYTVWDMFCASQRDSLTWQLPAGVAIKLKARQQICIQTHYVNASTQSTPTSRGKVLINLWTIPESTVAFTAGLLFASNTQIVIPPHDTLTVRKYIRQIPWDVYVLSLTGHFHSRGVNFWAVRESNDEEIYRNQSWDEPPVTIYPGLGYFLPHDDRIIYYSSFMNTTHDTIKMGPHVEHQEHSNMFMTFYPGPPDGKTIYDIDQGW